MPKSVSRHQLTIYQFMLDRWWGATLLTGITLLVLAAGLNYLPGFLPQYHFMGVPVWKLWVVAGAGGFAIIFSLFLILIRKNAFVQLHADHLRLSTPFLRLNISYRRITRTTTAELQQLFPPNHSSNWRKEMLRPLASRTVIVLELADLPISRSILLCFLSPIFFPDKSPRLALLVPDWIKFSTELESKRGVFKEEQHQSLDDNPRSHLLSDFKMVGKMNIYFACSITGGRQFEAVYQTITETLLNSGHDVPTAHLAETGVVALEKIVDAREIYTRDVTWIRACDALIAEVSTPSHGVGYEVAYALGIGKPVLCCHQSGQSVSKMITGNPDKNLRVVSYRDANQVGEIVLAFLHQLQANL